jgi:hypothetical protein
MESIFLFVSVCVVCVFTFVSIASWAGTRQQERTALYRTELLKKLSEQPPENARLVIALLREEEVRKEAEKRRGLLLGGSIVTAVGFGLMVMLVALVPREKAFTVGLIPLFIGIVLILFGRFAARTPSPALDVLPPAEPK